ncbi:MAG: hypothetical protein KY476_08380 [Planctomycetes bacterium]|nr:hypothetical protein [Planctomycetota bacterium]
MNVQLSPESEAFLKGELSRGVYRNLNDALNAAVQSLRQHKELIERLDEARRQLDNGEFTEYDEEGLARRFEELKQRVRSRHER